jgi:hypothetical protein
MSSVPVADVMLVDYCDLEAVVTLANRFGPDMSVIKRKERKSYNIIHRDRESHILREGDRVVYRTQQ